MARRFSDDEDEFEIAMKGHPREKALIRGHRIPRPITGSTKEYEARRDYIDTGEPIKLPKPKRSDFRKIIPVKKGYRGKVGRRRRSSYGLGRINIRFPKIRVKI